MPSLRLVIPTSTRLLVIATFHAIARLFADDEQLPLPDLGTLYRHGLSGSELLFHADKAGAQIHVNTNAAYTNVPLATASVHGIELELSLFSNDIDAAMLDAYGAHNRALAELSRMERDA